MDGEAAEGEAEIAKNHGKSRVFLGNSTDLPGAAMDLKQNHEMLHPL